LERPKDPIISSPLVARAARLGIVAWSTVGIAVLVYLFGRYVLYPVRIIFPPLILALIIVYLLNPVVSLLERRGLRRGLATFLTYLTILSAVGVGLAFLIPVVSHQAVEFGKSLPAFLSKAQQDLVTFARKLGLTVQGHDLFASFGPKGQFSNFVGRITSIGVGVLHVVLTVVLGIVIGFYLLMDLPKIAQGIKGAVPLGRRAEVEKIGRRLSVAIGGYFRGQLLVAAFVAVASMLGLYLVGLPYWAPVGLIAGLFNLVPLIGPFIGAIPALFIAFTTSHPGGGPIHLDPGWPLAVGASAVLLIVQQIDNHIVSPNVVARTVKIHPLTVMISLLGAGTLLGLWGMLLVIPVVASAKILLVHYWDTRMVWPPHEPDAPAVTPQDVPAVQASSAAHPHRERAQEAVAASDGPASDGKTSEDTERRDRMPRGWRVLTRLGSPRGKKARTEAGKS
jgi:predicted PurR-regulated permease PerM